MSTSTNLAAAYPRLQPTRSSQCSSLDQLPSELLRIICAHLQPTEVAAFRLLCRRIAEIGLCYLVPEARLIIKPSSFPRLDSITRNAVVAQNIQSLHFETDLLCRSLDSVGYEAFIMEEWVISHHSTTPCSCSPDERRTMDMCEKPTAKELKEGYEEFRGYIDEQKEVDTGRFWAKEMGEVLARMPNLKAVAVYSAGSLRPTSKSVTTAFPSCLGESVEYFPRGLLRDFETYKAARSLLVGLYASGLEVERLEFRYVDWILLDQLDFHIPSMKKIARKLKALGIHIITGKQSISIAEKGGLVDFLTAAPGLEILDVQLWTQDERWPVKNPAIKFRHVVGPLEQQSYWPNLQSATFAHLTATPDELVIWCERHSSSLRSLTIRCVALATGSWKAVLERLRRVMRLDYFRFEPKIEGGTVAGYEVRTPGARHLTKSMEEGIDNYVGEVQQNDWLPVWGYIDPF